MPSIYIIPDGGLGNRLRAVASGIYLSRELGRDPVIVWHRDRLCNADLGQIVELARLPAPIIRPSEAEFKLFYELPRLRNLHLPSLLSPLRFGKRFYDALNLNAYLDDCDALLHEAEGIHRDILFFSGQEFYDFPREFFREIVVASDAARVRAEEITAGLPLPEFTIQIRRTDHNLSIGHSPTGSFMEIIDSLSPAPVFLATDDEEVKAEAVSHAPGRVITNSARARRDTPEGIVDAMAELLVMSRTKRIYGSFRSSFPEIASWLGDVPLVTVDTAPGQ